MKPLPLIAAGLLLAGCSGGTSAAPATVTVTAPATTAPTAAASSPSTPPPTTAAAPTTSEPVADEADPDAPIQAKADETVDLGVLKVTATWLAPNPEGADPTEEHGRKGCQPVQLMIKNTSTTDFMQPEDGAASNASPSWSVSMEAGDTLRTVREVVRYDPSAWPKRIKAGKQATFTTCWLADEQEQQFSLNGHNGMDLKPRVVWTRS